MVFPIPVRGFGVGDGQDEITWTVAFQSARVNRDGDLVHILRAITEGRTGIEILEQHFGKIGDGVNNPGEEPLLCVASLVGNFKLEHHWNEPFQKQYPLPEQVTTVSGLR